MKERKNKLMIPWLDLFKTYLYLSAQRKQFSYITKKGTVNVSQNEPMVKVATIAVNIKCPLYYD